MPSADELSTDARAAIDERIEEIRRADFTASRRGYDRDEVQRYLGALADWLEGLGLGDRDRGEMRRELAWVGERTAEILTKAEETGHEMRENAAAEAEQLRAEAVAEAERMRAEAEEQAERSLEEAARQRHDLQVLIGDLLERRDEIIADGRRLADELGELFADADVAEEEPEPELDTDESELYEDAAVEAENAEELDDEFAAEGPGTEEQPSSAR